MNVNKLQISEHTTVRTHRNGEITNYLLLVYIYTGKLMVIGEKLSKHLFNSYVHIQK